MPTAAGRNGTGDLSPSGRYVIRPRVPLWRGAYPVAMERGQPPTRHLTFLFADVEGSTRIAERHAASAGAALARYHELVLDRSRRRRNYVIR